MVAVESTRYMHGWRHPKLHIYRYLCYDDSLILGRILRCPSLPSPSSSASVLLLVSRAYVPLTHYYRYTSAFLTITLTHVTLLR